MSSRHETFLFAVAQIKFAHAYMINMLYFFFIFFFIFLFFYFFLFFF